ncbi:hypothetical protein RJ639_041086 [Escallonia herrerae]|uniref:GH16 domain-containing protein n=1 Tax=Escallonia herrerae TaxID=1293975 RepID=A0AA89B4J4_9ASTE|nr:hypothetical protein RJ639_041086 [Escallonia herrerae]
MKSLMIKVMLCHSKEHEYVHPNPIPPKNFLSLPPLNWEFLGNSSGNPYTVHTNVYAQGKGNKEHQFYLWFDPTTAFHTYSIVSNPQRIIFLVDNSPIRVFQNSKAIGIPFPKSQPMRVYSSLWSADDWATQGWQVKTDWTKAPFTTFYRNYNAMGMLSHLQDHLVLLVILLMIRHGKLKNLILQAEIGSDGCKASL